MSPSPPTVAERLLPAWQRRWEDDRGRYYWGGRLMERHDDFVARIQEQAESADPLRNDDDDDEKKGRESESRESALEVEGQIQKIDGDFEKIISAFEALQKSRVATQEELDDFAGAQIEYDLHRQPLIEQLNQMRQPTKDDKLLYSCLRLVHEGASKAMQDPTKPTIHDLPADLVVNELETDTVDNMPPLKLRAHQRDGIGQLLYLEEHGGSWALGDDPGLGKTHQVIGLLALAKGSPTLLVTPVQLKDMWVKQTARLRSKKIVVYHGDTRAKLTVHDLQSADIVITTYETLRSEYVEFAKALVDFHSLRAGIKVRHVTKKKRKGKGKGGETETVRHVLSDKRPDSTLYAVRWHRVILEEAHRIKNRMTWTSQAAARMGKLAKMKGCITGTPFQNDYSDFFAIARFLDLKPFNRWSLFKRCFLKPESRGLSTTSHAVLQGDLLLVLASVRKSITVRREKDQEFNGEPITGLQPYKHHQIIVSLSPYAQALQDQKRDLWDYYQRTWKQLLGKDLQHHDSFFAAITEGLMQAINPILPTAKYGDRGEDDGLDALDVDVADGTADHQDFSVPDQLSKESAHERAARDEAAEMRKSKTTKDKELKVAKARRAAFIENMRTDETYHSDIIDTAVRQTMRNLKIAEAGALMQDSPRQQEAYRGSGGKQLTFCAYLTGNDAYACGLRAKGIEYHEINSFTSEKEREQILRDFEEQDEHGNPKNIWAPGYRASEVRVLIASPRIASEGMTLVKAAYVMFLGLSWNPYMELQALSRAWRIGQLRQVHAYWIYATNSMHTRVKFSQMIKLNKAEGAMRDEKLRKAAMRMVGLEFDEFKALVDSAGGIKTPPPEDGPKRRSRKRKPDFYLSSYLRDAAWLLNGDDEQDRDSGDEGGGQGGDDDEWVPIQRLQESLDRDQWAAELSGRLSEVGEQQNPDGATRTGEEQEEESDEE